jgi:Zn-finger nucleic acid-binding protein
MKCPVCNVELKIAERQGIEIDYCPQCRGTWLDRGELDKIIERSAAMEARQEFKGGSEYRREYRQDNYRRSEDDDYYKRKKRKSFLGELFDF